MVINIIIALVTFICISYTFYIKKIYETLIKTCTDEYLKKYNELIELQDYNQQVIDVFGANAQNKIYQVGLCLLRLKENYVETLNFMDEEENSELYDEIQKCIIAVDDQLKEIGFITNKERNCKSIIKNLYFLNDTDFSKN